MQDFLLNYNCQPALGCFAICKHTDQDSTNRKGNYNAYFTENRTWTSADATLCTVSQNDILSSFVNMQCKQRYRQMHAYDSIIKNSCSLINISC